MTAIPKPTRAKADPAYLALVRQVACVCCGRFPSEAHHPISGRYSQRKAPDRDAIALCGDHHRYRHAEPASFRALFGPEERLTAMTRAAVARIKANTIGGR